MYIIHASVSSKTLPQQLIQNMMVLRALMCSLLMFLLVDSSEGHITFFSPKEMMLMKEREGKKDMEPRSEDEQFQDVSLQPPEPEAAEEVQIVVRVAPLQLDHSVPVLEEFVHKQ
ncbi:unnamed protein product [Knipowitschia caucasica]